MLHKTRKGSQAEYFANYILSMLGFTVPVPRQEDYGIDFFCTLNESTDVRTLVGDSYAVQVKSNHKPLTYGKGPKNKHDKHQIEFLSSIKIPFFLCIVDLPNEKISFYPLSSFRFIKKEHPNCSLITFKTKAGIGDTTINGITQNAKAKRLKEDQGDGFNYIVDLQYPTLEIKAKDLANDEIMSNNIDILRTLIRMEQWNILFDQSKLPFFHWPYKYHTNLKDIHFKWIIYDDEIDVSILDQVLMHNGYLIISLALGFRLTGDEESYNHLKNIIKKLPDMYRLSELETKYPDLYR